MSDQTTFDFQLERSSDGAPVECLNQSFKDDAERREFYLSLLSEHLQDPNLLRRSGFPEGAVEHVLSLSDPPYYTACPNPFASEWIKANQKKNDPGVYERGPFAIDVSVGKTDQLYRAHSYHTKVPHLAIVPTILHYTEPGDIVFDGFCGSGMTGVAAQYCGSAPLEYRRELEEEWKGAGKCAPAWGARKAVLGDLGLAATFIAANYNTPLETEDFVKQAQTLLDQFEEEFGWMYETLHNPDTGSKGRINFTVWSEVFSCPTCGGEIVFLDRALDPKTKKVSKEFSCGHCDTVVTKKSVERLFETRLDHSTGEAWERIKIQPAFINYSFNGEKYEKPVDSFDREVLHRIEQLDVPASVPVNPIPIERMYHGSRLAPKGFTHVHKLFLPRAKQCLGILWEKVAVEKDRRIRNMLFWFLEQSIWNLSLANSYRPTGFSQVSQWMKGVYYIPSQHAEPSPWYVLQGKLKRLGKAFSKKVAFSGHTLVSTGDCADSGLPDISVDYIFTDPPFGENLHYADLNFLVESWHGLFTASDSEAIVDTAKKKTTADYQHLMRECFREYFRVLKPGRWMTVVFSNSSNQIWRAIQEAMGTAGFVIADVRTLDKKQGSYRQVTSSAVKQDLVISAYKPTAELTEKFSLDTADESSAWAFIAEHLKHVPVFVGRSGEEAEPVIERTPQMLHDRMVAFFVQRRMSIPISSPDFFAGLDERYAKRDGMYFLPDQVAEYDRKRMTVKELRELDLFVSDEASAIQWLRQQLGSKPQSFQDLQPQFMPQVQTWPKHEKDVDLKELLEHSFLRYDGKGEVPAQIANYLSKNYREFRGVSRESSALKEKAKDRWYVPDPRKTGDLEKLRAKTLLKEFEEYKNSKDRKIKLFRTEAVRAGFKDCYEKKDYDTIIKVWKKLPSKIVQEDEALVMYHDVASMRAGD